MLIQKICHKGLLHLQKIVSQPFSTNRKPHTGIAKLNIQKWHVWMSGKETSTKKLYFHKEKDWYDAAVTAENLTIPDAGASNKLICDGEIARS